MKCLICSFDTFKNNLFCYFCEKGINFDNIDIEYIIDKKLIYQKSYNKCIDCDEKTEDMFCNIYCYNMYYYINNINY